MSRRKVIIDGQEVDFTVVQPDATQLRATITPSGDMARKAYYDRNPIVIIRAWDGYVGPHTFTQRWSYTVPSGRKAMFAIYHHHIRYDIETPERMAYCNNRVSIAGAAAKTFAQTVLGYGMGFSISDSVGVPFLLKAGDVVTGNTGIDDTRYHSMIITGLLTEFDE